MLYKLQQNKNIKRKLHYPFYHKHNVKNVVMKKPYHANTHLSSTHFPFHFIEIYELLSKIKPNRPRKQRNQKKYITKERKNMIRRRFQTVKLGIVFILTIFIFFKKQKYERFRFIDFSGLSNSGGYRSDSRSSRSPIPYSNFWDYGYDLPNNFNQDKIDNSDPKYQKSPSQKTVLIISEYRAGSTFISELFNQRNDTLYIFEPLWIIEPWRPWRTLSVGNDTYVDNILSKILIDCELPNPHDKEQFPRPPTNNDGIYPWEYTNCQNHNICFRDRMKKLNLPPFCDKVGMQKEYLEAFAKEMLAESMGMGVQKSEKASSSPVKEASEYNMQIHEDFMYGMYGNEHSERFKHEMAASENRPRSKRSVDIETPTQIDGASISDPNYSNNYLAYDSTSSREAQAFTPTCPDIQLPTYKEFCAKSEIFATKILRLHGLREVERFLDKNSQKLVASGTTEINLIFEIRDPRAVLNSRLQIHIGDFDFGFDYCHVGLENLRWLRENRQSNQGGKDQFMKVINDQIKLKVLPVRYEDLAINPISTTKQIYDFIDISFPENIKTWIYNNTVSDGSREKCQEEEFSEFDEYGNWVGPLSSFNENSILEGDESIEDLMNPKQKCYYSTSRDSKKAVSRWVDILKSDEVDLVEKNGSCGDIFDSFGYKKINGRTIESQNMNLTDILQSSYKL